MASAMRKMAVYLGLVEDDRHYDERYADEFAEADGYDDYIGEHPEAEEPPLARGAHNGDLRHNGDVRHNGDLRHDVPPPRTERRAAPAVQTADLTRITTLHPRTYNEARTIGEHFRDGTPVIVNLTEMVDSDAKRLVDFSAGLIFGLRGSIERVTNKVFLLSPANVEVTAEDKARIAERDFFNQS
jgi:cell division inhibitor SepF